MGDCFSFCNKQQGRNSHNSKLKMLRFVVILSLAAFAYGAPSGHGGHAYAHQQTHCHTKYNIKIDQQCHQEYDTVVDTTYTQQCQDIVTKHCQSTHKQVHHSSAVVGHDSKVVSHGYGYGKRDAEAEPGYGSQGYSSGPQCQQHVEKQCQKVPHQTQRQIPRQVCVPVEVKVPYEVCGTSYVQKQQYNTGYGYH